MIFLTNMGQTGEDFWRFFCDDDAIFVADFLGICAYYHKYSTSPYFMRMYVLYVCM